MDRLYVGLLIGFVLGVWISFIVVVIAARSTRRNQPPPRSAMDGYPQQPPYRVEPTPSMRDLAEPTQSVVTAPTRSAPSQPMTTTTPPRPPASYREAAQANSTTRELFHQLLGMVSGDEAVTNRLIDNERQRAAGAPLAIWIQNAIDRLVHDRR
jgi:hypothetical protein